MEKYLKTGYKELDNALNGGLKKGNLVLLASRPALGKTSLALNILKNCLFDDSNLKCAIFSIEMIKEYNIDRLVSILSNVGIEKIQKGGLTQTDLEAISLAKDKLNEFDIFIEDDYHVTCKNIIEICEKLKSEKGLDFVIIDYFQLINFEKFKPKTDDRKKDNERWARELKLAAKKLGITILLLSQVPHITEFRDDKRPIINDLMFYGQIAEEIDDILFIYNSGSYKISDDGIIELIIAKTNHGEEKTIKLKFDKNCLRFEDVTL